MAKHEPPRRELEIVAKAGFITKELWRDHIYGSVGQTDTEKRRYHWAWKNLIEKGYLIQHPNKHLSNILVLNRNSREAMRHIGNVASRSPYESNLHHDEILLRGALKVQDAALVHHWTLETELKSIERDEFRLTSQGKSLKYPDAVFYLNPASTNRKVAVEIELTLKDRSRYRQIIGAYSFLEDLSLVLFVTGTPAIEKAIRGTIERDPMAKGKERFGFMSLMNWRIDPLEGEIDLMGRRTTLKRFASS